MDYNINLDFFRTPSYVIDEVAIEDNLKLLRGIQLQTGCKILLALKGFACFYFAPLVNKYLAGTTASSIDEARLGRDEFGGEVHICAPAYKDDEIRYLLGIVDHIVFNSFSQWRRYKDLLRNYPKDIKCGIRINPEHREVDVEKYDPCGFASRLGVVCDEFSKQEMDGISGIHFHTLCELNADSLERTLRVVESKFGDVLNKVEWVNFGGGHHITRKDYDRDKLCDLINNFRRKYSVDVYLEPGEAVALNTGVLVSEVLDIIHNKMDIAILDTSASTHMPDVLEMPYRPEIIGAGKPNEKAYTYRLGGVTCLAGDVIGDYSFDKPLEIGDRLVFTDMAHYSIVKNTTFNGIRLPSIAVWNSSLQKGKVIREFGYEDFKSRLG